MEKTWFESVFRRRPHAVLRLLGNLVLCAMQVFWVVWVLVSFDGAWRWLAVPLGFMALLSDSRGVVLAVRDLRKRGGSPVPD
ncbi:hypothetical protein ACFYPN_33230 [Streptomyces sp. NPDC005576]|uniref:hypothetical protein n=1 Tax=unclassified Streptomyces TaxID=2593676 RepID=UPI00340BBC2A